MKVVLHFDLFWRTEPIGILSDCTTYLQVFLHTRKQALGGSDLLGMQRPSILFFNCQVTPRPKKVDFCQEKPKFAAYLDSTKASLVESESETLWPTLKDSA